MQHFNNNNNNKFGTCVEPVSWLSRNVTDLEGHHPITPGGFPLGSFKRQKSPLTASYNKEPQFTWVNYLKEI